MRAVTWFSCGIASAVSAHLMLEKYRGQMETVIARCVITSEHGDNDRFAADCARQFNHPIVELKSERYADTWDVYKKRRFLVGPKGALCTTELKKIPRFSFQRPDDIQIFGYTVEEKDRAAQFREQNPDVILSTPLIDAGLGKADCHDIVRRWGIAAPAMYGLGYRNNNCIGCVKGGAGYWNKIRVDFPEVFDRMAKVERELNVSIIRLGRPKRQVFLDELPTKTGGYDNEGDIDCGLLCAGLPESEKP